MTLENSKVMDTKKSHRRSKDLLKPIVGKDSPYKYYYTNTIILKIYVNFIFGKSLMTYEFIHKSLNRNPNCPISENF